MVFLFFLYCFTYVLSKYFIHNYKWTKVGVFNTLKLWWFCSFLVIVHKFVYLSSTTLWKPWSIFPNRASWIHSLFSKKMFCLYLLFLSLHKTWIYPLFFVHCSYQWLSIISYNLTKIVRSDCLDISEWLNFFRISFSQFQYCCL